MAYLAKTGLRYPVGAKNIKHAQDGDLDKVTKWKSVAAGEVTDDVPDCSVPWLLDRGMIEAVDNVVELTPAEDEVA